MTVEYLDKQYEIQKELKNIEEKRAEAKKQLFQLGAAPKESDAYVLELQKARELAKKAGIDDIRFIFDRIEKKYVPSF